MTRYRYLLASIVVAMSSAISMAYSGEDVATVPAQTQVSYNNNPQAIDLGLSVRWADRNLGASAPEKLGGHYGWGETRSFPVNYDAYSYDYYQAYPYIYADSVINEVVGTGLDAARKRWGSPWRMPTEDEFNALRDSCQWTATTQKGVKGITITGPNGNSIFLPCEMVGEDYDYSAGKYVTYSYAKYRCGDESNYSSTSVMTINANSGLTASWADRCLRVLIRPVLKTDAAGTPIDDYPTPDYVIPKLSYNESVTVGNFVFTESDSYYSQLTLNDIKDKSIETLSIPARLYVNTTWVNLRSIKPEALSSCERLKIIELIGSTPYYKTVDGVLYDGDLSEVVFFPPAKSGSYEIPETVYDISAIDFEKCAITELVVPSTMGNIPINQLSSSSSLQAINVSPENSWFSSINGVLYDKEQKILIFYPRGAVAAEFVIPETVEIIAENAFSDNKNLKKVTLNADIEEIGAHAFANCTNLAEVISLAEYPPVVGECAFSKIKKNATLYVPEIGLEDYNVDEDWTDAKWGKIEAYDPTPFPWVLIAIIAGGVISLLLIVWIIVIIVKRKKTSQSEKANSEGIEIAGVVDVGENADETLVVEPIVEVVEAAVPEQVLAPEHSSEQQQIQDFLASKTPQELEEIINSQDVYAKKIVIAARKRYNAKD